MKESLKVFRNYIKYVYKQRLNNKDVKKFVKENREYLKNGCYIYSYVRHGFLYRKDGRNTTIGKNIHSKRKSSTASRHFFRRIIDTLLLRGKYILVFTKNKNKKASADRIIKKAEGSYKIFDTVNEVSYLFGLITDLETLQSRIEILNKYFNVNLYEFNTQDRVVKSKYIIGDTLGKKNNNIKYFEKILDSYLFYLENVLSEKTISPRRILDRLSVNPYFEESILPKVLPFIEDIIDIEIPTVLQHGDFHPENIIIDSNDEIWLIDFDLMHYGPWFEDLFTLYFYDTTKNKSIVLLKKTIKQGFGLTGYSYEDDFYEKYLIVSLLSRWSNIFDIRKDLNILKSLYSLNNQISKITENL